MAFYKYYCKKCGEIEINKPMSESSRKENCPHCNSEMERKYEAPHVVWNCGGNCGKSN